MTSPVPELLTAMVKPTGLPALTVEWSAASGAVAHLEQVWEAHQFVELDPEEYHDFQVNRPITGMDDDGMRKITWPSTQLSVCSPPGALRDVRRVVRAERSTSSRARVHSGRFVCRCQAIPVFSAFVRQSSPTRAT